VFKQNKNIKYFSPTLNISHISKPRDQMSDSITWLSLIASGANHWIGLGN